MKNQHYLSVSTIIKDEALYLEEWLAWNLLEGVEHFYLYDNGSTDNTKELLKKHSKYVTLIDWPGEAMQYPSVEHTLEHFRHKTDWCAFIDADEFLFSTRSTFKEELFHLDQNYGMAALAVHWLLYGSNGELTYSPEPVIQRFTRRANRVDPHVKSIVRMRNVLSRGRDVHHFHVRGKVIDEAGRELPEIYSLCEGSANNLRINHYVTKSKAEAAIRYARKRCDINQPRDFAIHFPAHDKNEIEDLAAWKNLRSVKVMLDTWKKSL